MDPLIKVRKLDVAYFMGKPNEVHALKNINLEIYPGEFIIFFGPSGCGKSTVLYSIAGLEKNIQGNIYIDGKDLSKFNEKELEHFHRRRTGMIFQAFYLINSLSSLGNVVLPQIFIKKTKKERRAKALELLDYFGVKNQADKLPTKLSGGQQQRVAIARSLINDPSILLADEPIGNLDSASAEEVMNLLKDLNINQNKTIIMVTHNPAHLNIAHRVFYMKDGNIIDTKVNQAIDENVITTGSDTGQTISKDLELLARSYSGISSGETGNLLIPFKAKQIVSEVLTGMTTENLGKIEKKVEQLLMMGTRGNVDLLKFLDVSDLKGGMDMDRRTAEKLSKSINNIIKEIDLMVEEENKLKERKIIDSSNEVAEIRHYLLDFYNLEINDVSSLKRLDKVILLRLANKIDKATARKKLDLPIKKGGVGLNRKTAKKVAQRLELLILGKFK